MRYLEQWLTDTTQVLYESAIIILCPLPPSLFQDAVCRRAESEALACPQGRQASRGPGSGEGTRG